MWMRWYVDILKFRIKPGINFELLLPRLIPGMFRNNAHFSGLHSGDDPCTYLTLDPHTRCSVLFPVPLFLTKNRILLFFRQNAVPAVLIRTRESIPEQSELIRYFQLFQLLQPRPP